MTETAAPKLAQTLAQRIEREILNRHLPVGHRLGTELELLARYKVSRAVLREAIRMVERHRLGETRRGFGGGLFVAQPPRDAMARVLSRYLESAGVGVPELFEARRYIEAVTVGCAAERITDEGARDLRKIVADRELVLSSEDELRIHERFHTAIAELARNPVLALFVQAMHQVSQDIGLSPDLTEAELRKAQTTLWEEKRNIAEAIVAGDAGRARCLMNGHLLEREEHLERARPRRRRARAGRPRGKLAETIARELSREIRSRHWSVGKRIGSEPELTERYGVSRSILREAVRMLEQHGVAEMRRGVGGGLFVAEPDPAAVVLSASVYVAHLDLDSESLQEARDALDPLAASLAAERASDDELRELGRALGRALATEDRRSFVAASRALHEQIVDLMGNRVLSLFSRVVITAAWGDIEAGPHRLPPGWQDDLRANHMALVVAIQERDPARARNAMLKHLAATTDWWDAARH